MVLLIDSMAGGTGNDTFNVNSGTDTVTDLSGSDVLVVSSGATATVTVTAAFTATSATTNAGTANLSTNGFAVNLSAATLSGTTGYSVTNGNTATTITGSGGNDTITGGNKADILLGGAGNDTISGGSGNIADTITGGLGADVIDAGNGLDTVIVAAGDTVLTIGGSGNAGTISGFDTVSNLAAGTASADSETLDTAGTATVVGNGDVNGTDSSLTIAGNFISSHRVSSGIITFDDAGSFVAALAIDSDAKLAAVVQYLQLQDLGNAGATVAFNYGSDTYVYTQGSDNGIDNSLDVLVKLVGVQADSLKTTNGTGLNDLFIA